MPPPPRMYPCWVSDAHADDNVPKKHHIVLLDAHNRLVVCQSRPRLHALQGVVDLASLCWAFSEANADAELTLSTQNDSPTILQAPEIDDEYAVPPSLRNTCMRPTRRPHPELTAAASPNQDFVSDTLNAAAAAAKSAAEAAQEALKAMISGTPETSSINKFLNELAEGSVETFKSTFQLSACQQDDVVYTMSGGGKKLSGGVVELQPNTYIVFDETYTDVYLRDITFKGMNLPCSV